MLNMRLVALLGVLLAVQSYLTVPICIFKEVGHKGPEFALKGRDLRASFGGFLRISKAHLAAAAAATAASFAVAEAAEVQRTRQGR